MFRYAVLGIGMLVLFSGCAMAEESDLAAQLQLMLDVGAQGGTAYDHFPATAEKPYHQEKEYLQRLASLYAMTQLALEQDRVPARRQIVLTEIVDIANELLRKHTDLLGEKDAAEVKHLLDFPPIKNIKVLESTLTKLASLVERQPSEMKESRLNEIKKDLQFYKSFDVDRDLRRSYLRFDSQADFRKERKRRLDEYERSLDNATILEELERVELTGGTTRTFQIRNKLLSLDFGYTNEGLRQKPTH